MITYARTSCGKTVDRLMVPGPNSTEDELCRDCSTAMPCPSRLSCKCFLKWDTAHGTTATNDCMGIQGPCKRFSPIHAGAIAAVQ